MGESTVNIMVDSELKEGAERVAERLGFDLASVPRAFLRQIVRENRIPPDLLGAEPNAESLESIREAGRIIDAGGSSQVTMKVCENCGHAWTARRM